MTILPVPILTDNYVWLAHVNGQALVVDPGEAQPVRAVLDALGLTLVAILVTHHHGDHIGGVAELAVAAGCAVFGPETIACVTHPVSEGDRIPLPALDTEFEVIAVPGHTLDHLAYVGDEALFCGDTLFACGCGRLFEGTPAQMQHALAKLRALPQTLRVYCTHEYTLANQRFARAVEPHNVELAARCQRDAALRAKQQATLPSNLLLECETNPFLRWDAPAVMAAARSNGAANDSPVEVFAALRRWKDGFSG